MKSTLTAANLPGEEGVGKQQVSSPGSALYLPGNFQAVTRLASQYYGLLLDTEDKSSSLLILVRFWSSGPVFAVHRSGPVIALIGLMKTTLSLARSVASLFQFHFPDEKHEAPKS